MIGSYNVYNALAAIAASYHSGLTLGMIQEALTQFQGVPGRTQLIQENLLV
ncbi:MAG: hypothetical protein R2865_11980 [Deinococcales bacterium]